MIRDATLVMLLWLSGCVALPPWVSYVSFGVDGAVLVITDKTPADHAISLALDKDCALWRFVKRQEICQEDQEKRTLRRRGVRPWSNTGLADLP